MIFPPSVPHAGVLPGGDGPIPHRLIKSFRSHRTMTQPLASLVRVVPRWSLALRSGPRRLRPGHERRRPDLVRPVVAPDQPSLEVFYTIPAPPRAAPTLTAPSPGPPGGAPASRPCP
jgi:hypothetical protein